MHQQAKQASALNAQTPHERILIRRIGAPPVMSRANKFAERFLEQDHKAVHIAETVIERRRSDSDHVRFPHVTNNSILLCTDNESTRYTLHVSVGRLTVDTITNGTPTVNNQHNDKFTQHNDKFKRSTHPLTCSSCCTGRTGQLSSSDNWHPRWLGSDGVKMVNQSGGRW